MLPHNSKHSQFYFQLIILPLLPISMFPFVQLECDHVKLVWYAPCFNSFKIDIMLINKICLFLVCFAALPIIYDFLCVFQPKQLFLDNRSLRIVIVDLRVADVGKFRWSTDPISFAKKVCSTLAFYVDAIVNQFR